MESKKTRNEMTHRGHQLRNRSEESNGARCIGEGSSRGIANSHGHGHAAEITHTQALRSAKESNPVVPRTKRGATEPNFMKGGKDAFPRLGQTSSSTNNAALRVPPFLAATAHKYIPKTHIGPWELGKTVGVGGTCNVRLVRHARTG